MYCWDERKDEINRAERKLGFAAAALLFARPVVEVEDTRHPYPETRINAYGRIDGRLYVCCYTPVYGWKHIISFRKCNPREEKRYG